MGFRCIVIIIWLSLFNQLSYSQDKADSREKKFDGITTLALVVGIPTGTFASTGGSNEAGYAEAGFGFDATHSRRSKRTGSSWMFTIKYLSFSYDMDSYVDNVRKGSTPGTWAGQGGNWKMLSFLGGGSMVVTKWERSSIEWRIQMGVTKIMVRSILVEGIGTNASYKFEIHGEDKPGSAFTYLTGVAWRVQMKRGVSFLSSIDFFGTTPSLVQEGIVTLVGAAPTTYSTPFSQPINALLLSAGFTF